MKKVIVAGSRNFDDYIFVKQVLLSYFKKFNLHSEDIEIVSGGCRGVDKLGKRFASEFGYKCTQFLPDWNTYGKSAGYKRNLQMGEYAKKDGMLIAFWDGESKGTKLMIDIAERLGIETHIVSIE